MGDAGLRMSEPLGPHGSKFTPEIKERFLNAIRYNGMTLRAASAAAGISYRTLERWFAQAREEAEGFEGRGSPGHLTEFFLDVELAQGDALSTMELKQHQLAMEGDGPSLRHWLRAHDPATWSRRQAGPAVLVTGEHAQVAVLHEGTSDDPNDYFGVQSIQTAPAIEAPE